jgi:uncharacterized repeat protein (TIGR01451 family)
VKFTNRRLFRSLIGSLVLWSASNLHAPTAQAAPFQCDGTLYISQAAATGDPTQLNDLVTTTTPFTLTGRGTPQFEFNGMGFRFQDGFIYGINPLPNSGIAGPNDNEIYRIDDTGIPVSLGVPQTTGGTTLTTLTPGARYIAGDFNTYTGTYFAYSPIPTPNGNLVEIDVTTSPPTILRREQYTPPPDFADIAFNPVDGRFYGFDRNQNRIRFFDPANPTVLSNVPTGSGTPTVTAPDNIGATFFDAAGNFYAYRNSGILYRVDLATGNYTTLGSAPAVGLNDGAGCPVAPVMEKVVSPASTTPGSTVTYTYRIINQTNLSLPVTFTDTMDGNRTFVTPTPPLRGGVISEALFDASPSPSLNINNIPNATNRSQATISNLNVPRGVHTITLQVQIPAGTPTPSTLFNQAIIEGPGVSSPPIISRSDFPGTPESPDETPLQIVPPGNADLSITKTGATTTTAGNSIAYTITVTNNGPSDATNVSVEDSINTGTNIDATFVSASDSGAETAPGSGIVRWPAVNIPAGGSVQRTVTINLPNAGNYQNTTTVSADNPDPTPGNNSASAPTNVTAVATAEIGVTKTGATSIPAPGLVTYTITATNYSTTTTATDVTITDNINTGTATGATLVSASDGGTETGGIITWPTINIPPDTSLTRTVTLSLPNSTTGGTSYANTSTVGSTNEDAANTIPNTSTAETTIPPSGPADITTTKTGVTNLPSPGRVTYTITTTNQSGTNSAINVVMSDRIADGAVFESASDGGMYSPTTRTATWPATNIPPNTSTSRTVIVQLPNAGSYTNTASSTSANDVDPNNNSGTVTTTVPNEPDLTIDKSSTSSFSAGASASFTITVTNVGANATDGSIVTITDNLPAELTAGTPTGAGWDCSASTATTVTCTRSDILGSTQSYPAITVPVTVGAVTVGTLPARNQIINTASVAGGGDNNPNNNSDTVRFPVLGTEPDLAITKTATPTTQSSGGLATYGLIVENRGTSATDGSAVRVSENLPNGVIFDQNRSIVANGWTCSVTGQTVNCTRSDVLAVGTSYPEISIPVIITAAAGTTIINLASVSGGGEATDPNILLNNSAQANILTIGGFSPLGLAKQIGTVTDNGDGTFTIPFTIVVQNFGPTTITNVQVADNLFGDASSTFNGVSSVTVTTPPTVTGGLTAANPTFNGSTDRNLLSGTQALNAGALATINFSVRVNPGNNTGPYRNLASGSATNVSGAQVIGSSIPGTNPDPDGDGNPGNNTDPTPIVLPIGQTNFRLVKRITGVTRDGSPLPGVDFSRFIDDPNDPDDNADWSGLTLAGFTALGDDNVLQSDDVVEYTIYYLADGAQTVTNARICDAIPVGTTFVSNSFGGSNGIQLRQGTTETNLTNTADSDRGQFFSPLSRADSVVPPCPNANNPTGAVFVNLGDVPNTGTNRLGFVRFRVKLD